MTRATLGSMSEEGPGSRKMWLLRISSIAIGLTVALLVAEITIRILEPVGDSQLTPVEDPERIYGYPPDSAGYAGGVAFRTNSLGLRGPDRPPPGESDFVIAVLGDSYAFGYGVAYEDAFPAVLERELDARTSAYSVRTETLAFPGYNTKQMFATLRGYAPRIRPDLVLLSYHLNDIERHFAGGNGNPEAGRGVRLRDVRQRLRLVNFVLPRLAVGARMLGLPVRTTASAEIEEYVGRGSLWERNERALEELLEYCRAHGLPVAVVVLPYMVQFDERHVPRPAYEVVRAWFADRGVPVTVAFDRFLGRRAGDFWIHSFDGHPNAAGHALIAEAALDLIEKNGLLP